MEHYVLNTRRINEIAKKVIDRPLTEEEEFWVTQQLTLSGSYKEFEFIVVADKIRNMDDF